MIRTTLAAAVALALVAPLGACSKGADAPAKTAASADKTIAEAIAGAPQLTKVSAAITEAGLADVFDGPGSYTLLAPDDEAFTKLGATGTTLTAPEHRAELVAILRGHILPGHLTPDAIKKAIADKKGPVTMTTLADGSVTFAESGSDLVVTSSDGSKAKIDGDALVASNGVVLPVDGLVKSAKPAAGG
jgi:uncharacterized surface protein with fasciclin (FAS1) repeats